MLETYAALYLKEEVQMEGLVRNIGSFSRFLNAISFSHASLLNVSNVARECEVERKVVDGYVAVLEDLLLGYRLPVFTKRARRAVVKHPKFYLFDAGVYRSLRAEGPLDRPEEIQGSALEGMVAQHLRAWIDYSPDNFTLYFWRTRGGVEVDFVVYGTWWHFCHRGEKRRPHSSSRSQGPQDLPARLPREQSLSPVPWRGAVDERRRLVFALRRVSKGFASRARDRQNHRKTVMALTTAIALRKLGISAVIAVGSGER